MENDRVSRSSEEAHRDSIESSTSDRNQSVDSTHLIFVYGSLKRGFRLHHLLNGQIFCGAASTLPNFRLFDVGSYPGLIEAAPGVSILGELFDVTSECLQRLDNAEGVAEGLYARRPIVLLPPWHQQFVEAWYYLPTVAGLKDCGFEWPCPPEE